MQGRFNVQNQSSMLSLKKKNIPHQLMTAKAFAKIQHVFMTEILNKLEIEGNLLDKNNLKMKDKGETRKRCPFSPLPLNIIQY